VTHTRTPIGLALAVSLALSAGAAIHSAAAAQEATEEEQNFLDAAMDGEVQLVKELLEKGVDVNVTYDEDGINALMQAAAGSHVEVVKALLEAGAKVGAKNAMAIAESYDDQRVKKVVIELGAK
jgi:ankyrin repeat protein